MENYLFNLGGEYIRSWHLIPQTFLVSCLFLKKKKSVWAPVPGMAPRVLCTEHCLRGQVLSYRFRCIYLKVGKPAHHINVTRTAKLSRRFTLWLSPQLFTDFQKLMYRCFANVPWPSAAWMPFKIHLQSKITSTVAWYLTYVIPLKL